MPIRFQSPATLDIVMLRTSPGIWSVLWESGLIRAGSSSMTRCLA